MTRLLRIGRGVLGMALMWGVTWSALAVSVRIVRHLTRPVEPTWHDLWINSIVPASEYGLVYGAPMGALVVTLLAVTSVRVESIDALSIPLTLALGTVVSLGAHVAVSGLTFSSLGVLLVSAALGFRASSGMLLMARRAKMLPLATHSCELLFVQRAVAAGCGSMVRRVMPRARARSITAHLLVPPPQNAGS